jgi:hypothetical protein
MNITIYEVFELNRILHSLLEQQSSYNIQTAFKIHSLVKWLDETEKFLFNRMNMLFNEDETDVKNPLYVAFLNSQIPFVKTDLKVNDLLNTDGNVNLDIKDVEVLNKMLCKTED